MKAGLSTYACSWAIGIPGSTPNKPLTVDGFLQRAKEKRFSLVQIADNLPLDVFAEEELIRVKQLADELGIDIEVGTRGLTEENMERYLDIARILGASLLRVVAAGPGINPGPEEIVRILGGLESAAVRSGIKIGLENHDSMSSGELARIMERLSSPNIGICLDTVNSFGALEGPETVIGRLSPYVVNIHLKDFRIYRQDHGMGFILDGTPAGEGQLDIPALLAHKHIAGRKDITAVLELWVPRRSSVEKTIRTEEEWIDRSRVRIEEWFEL